MPPKGKKQGGGERSKDDEGAAEPLQAIVFADSFETKFHPFTLETPRCLIPLANVPLIEYTLEFLAHSGVEEVYIYCGAHTSQVEEYLGKSKWSKSSAPFKLETIRSVSQSIGDAMRDLDKRATMTGDFIVVYGDVVSNFPLEAALAEHKARRKENKDAIMTMILREVGAGHRSMKAGPSPIFVNDPTKNRCLHYEEMSRSQDRRYLEIDSDILTSHQEVEVRYDLIDCGIDICTPDVLALWSDNFDYELPRRGFLYGVLKDYELNNKTVHTHIIKEHYAARVRNPAMYDAISRDVIARWAYPMSPDNNLFEGHTYRREKQNVYKERNVRHAKRCTIGSATVIGQGSVIGEGTTVLRSVLGRNCKIGQNCLIEDAYLWDGVDIGDFSEIRHAIIANNAVVGKKSSILNGALVSYGVNIAPETNLGERKVVMITQPHGSDLKSAQVSNEAKVETINGEDEEEESLMGALYSMQHLSMSVESISTLHSEDESEEPVHHNRSTANSFLSVASDDSHASQPATDFLHDAAASIYDSLQKGHDSANIALELSAMRMAANASEHQVRRAVATALTKRLAEVVKAGTTAKQAADEVLTPHKILIQRTIFDGDNEEKVDQVDFLLLLQSNLAIRDEGDSILLWTVRQLYNDMDVLEEEGIAQWWADPRSTEKEDLVLVRAKTQQLVDALAEMESEDEESD